MGVSGISTGFPVLSQSLGQIAHVLLTRSPLDLRRCKHQLDLVRLACVRHAASVRPEPGSNSPSRSKGPPEGFPKNQRVKTKGSSVLTAVDISEEIPSALCVLLIDGRLRDINVKKPPALAFGSHSSVFKEQPRTEPRRERYVTWADSEELARRTVDLRFRRPPERSCNSSWSVRCCQRRPARSSFHLAVGRNETLAASIGRCQSALRGR